MIMGHSISLTHAHPHTLTHAHPHTHSHTHTHSAKCIDRYTELKVREFDGQLEERIDPQLEDIVNRMFARCLGDRRYKQAIGVAFETRRLDILERVLNEAVRQAYTINSVIFVFFSW